MSSPIVSALILAGGKATRFGGIAKHELVVDGETIFARQLALLGPRVAEVIVSRPFANAELESAPGGTSNESAAGGLTSNESAAGGRSGKQSAAGGNESAADGRTSNESAAGGRTSNESATVVSAGATSPGFRSVIDRMADIGPLAGIAAGLAAVRTPWLLVVAGDMPHLEPGLIDRMIACAEAGAAPISVHAVERPADASTLDAVGVRAGGLPEPLLCVLHQRVGAVVEARIARGRYKASQLLTDAGLRVAWIDDADPRGLRNVNSPEDL